MVVQLENDIKATVNLPCGCQLIERFRKRKGEEAIDSIAVDSLGYCSSHNQISDQRARTIIQDTVRGILKDLARNRVMESL